MSSIQCVSMLKSLFKSDNFDEIIELKAAPFIFKVKMALLLPLPAEIVVVVAVIDGIVVFFCINVLGIMTGRRLKSKEVGELFNDKEKCHSIRFEVFVKEQNCSPEGEIDEYDTDPNCYYLLALKNSIPIGTTFSNYPTASELFVDYTTNLMRDYWEKGVLEMDNLYRGFDIPERLFKNVKFEVYDGTKESEQYRFMEADWTVSQYEKYLKTFSLKYPNAENPVDKLIARMKEAEGWEDDQLLKIYWRTAFILAEKN
ncbi:416_t:CDS:2 [Entrophospora sp. SA101]|nr:416_t:CDS:2 [Entrophospora sp. SA101]CAJ0861659.1 17624_t:CDS:2 [Entrophospora sp. SA101]